MKHIIPLFSFILLVFLSSTIYAQNVGIGNVTPMNTLHITSESDSGLLIENKNTLNTDIRAGIYFGNNVINNPGGNRYTGAIKTIGTSANEARLGLFTYAGINTNTLLERLTIRDDGNVGIGNINPLFKFDVNGNIHSSSNGYFEGSVGIGTTSPVYKLQVNNGSIALYNTLDLKTWYMSYSSASNYFFLSEGGSNRLVIANGGNVGIGTNAPTEKLDVNGNVNISGNTDVGGNLTVSAGKGIIRNTGTGQLKYYTREAAFTAVLAGSALSSEGSFGFASAGFTSAPAVTVGDIVSTGGTAGQLYRVQLIVYGCTTTSCKCRLLNTSPNAVDYDVTYNIICIGQ